MQLDIVKKIKLSRSLAFLKKLAAKISRKYKLSDTVVSLVFVSSREIRKLNKFYRGLDKVTDVLSFLYEDRELLGEIFICYELVKRQAKGQRVTIAQEMSRLFVHGMLHLLGFSHETPLKAAKMEKEEDCLLDQI